MLLIQLPTRTQRSAAFDTNRMGGQSLTEDARLTSNYILCDGVIIDIHKMAIISIKIMP
jgi:hypothetical protein